MRKPFYSVVSNKSADAGRINIYGVIGPDYWNDGIEAKKFIRDLSNLESSFDRVDIHINSPGGSIWDGLPIFNAIRASNKDIHTYIDGIAFSMGAIIALSGHTVHAAKGSLMMLHNASGVAAGNSKRMRSAADMLDKHDDVLCQLIADKSGKTVEEVKSLWMNMNDNFLTAQEAFDFKLVDVMETYAAGEMPENISNMSMHQVAAFYQEQMEEPGDNLIGKIIDKVKNHFSNNQNSNMDITKIKALAGETAPSQELLDAANAELTTAGVTNATIVTEEQLTAATEATNQLADAVIAKEDAEASLATANQEIAKLKARIAKGPGAIHTPAAGADQAVDVTTETTPEETIANLPHNKLAESYL